MAPFRIPMFTLIVSRLRRLPSPLALLGATIAALVLLAHWSAPAAPSEQPQPQRNLLTVAIAPLHQEHWPDTLTASGAVAPWQEISVVAEVDGLRVAEILADVGDHVKAGQLLARLSDTGVRADLEQARATLDEARAQSADAAQTLARVAGMSERGALSDQQIAQYRLASSVAAAREAAARAVLKQQQRRLAATRVVAPDSGIVSARGAVLGAAGATGSELFRLIRQGRLEWQAEIAQEELPRVASGMAAQIELSTRQPQAQWQAQSLEGRVRTVGVMLDKASRNALAYVELPSSSALRAGMYVRGAISTGASRAAVLPQQAVVMRDGLPAVFSVTAGGRAVLHKVKLGRRQGELVEIVAGLPPNAEEARFVTLGAGLVGDGDQVRVAAPRRVSLQEEGTR
ncbi:MAG: Cobalt-zinc-cadmium resistance protein CzcB [Herbaspirillum frisingense]|uniref:Cobalt-zinc-cadmium resistance protein CzcB n=1 Tax=Herbaspirillum frisingense TaxID=92645 RepID=A0A7V8FYH7_9BURK|nr:MAG: Cobalt-zinc-cadmium resistance protein CzcB [Herbaspirillum frisingense]